ncbi:MAG: hypothetical protein J7604_00020 [Sporocytophaga sp.]|uniref:hypothetical protein n=1 Tax=Sporocytophaga sp. TaxID=2231183 RepID=UPI001B26F448|nr:hypothetical protein [Sporocytophaga sp.]MBO9698556.1 hypothetical protein [Sporocytophaga sp.]
MFKSLLIFIILLFSSSFSIDGIVNVDQIDTFTIEQYYFMLPAEDYFNCEFSPKPDATFRKMYIIKSNVKNGYLVASDKNDFSIEMALFKDKIIGRDIIAVFSRGCNIGGQCPPRYDFWTYKNKQWFNVTKELVNLESVSKKVEQESGSIPGYLLPELGTDIKVVECDSKKDLGYRLKWVNSKFELIKNSAVPSKSDASSIKAYKLVRGSANFPNCKIRYSVEEENGNSVKLSEEVNSILNCPALLVITPDKKSLLYGSGNSIKLYNIQNSNTQVLFSEENNGVSNPLWSADGKHFAFVIVNEKSINTRQNL